MDNLIHWTLPYLILVLVIGAFGFVAKRKLLYIAALVILWTGTFTISGVGVSPEKLFLCIVFAYVVIFRLSNRGPQIPFFWSYFLLICYFVIYSILMSFQVPLNELSNLSPTALQIPPLRGILSTILFCISAVLIYFPFSNNGHPENLRTILRVMFGSAGFVMLVFALQLIFKILIPSMDSIFSALSSDSLKVIVDLPGDGFLDFRPSLFSSEPKYFGLAFGNIAAFAILQRRIRLPYLAVWISSPFFLIACLFCLVISSSVAAASSFLVGCSAILYLTESKRITIGRRVTGFFWVSLFVTFVAVLIFVDSDFTQRFELYIRLSQGGFNDNSNGANLSTTAYILWMLNDPSKLFFGVGFGNGAFYAFDYISGNSGFSQQGFSSSRVPIIDLISSVGIFGASLLYFLWFRFLSYIHVCSKKLSSDKSQELLFVRGCIIYYIFSGFIYNTNMYVWLFFGLAFSIVYSCKRRGLMNAI